MALDLDLEGREELADHGKAVSQGRHTQVWGLRGAMVTEGGREGGCADPRGTWKLSEALTRVKRTGPAIRESLMEPLVKPAERKVLLQGARYFQEPDEN